MLRDAYLKGCERQGPVGGNEPFLALINSRLGIVVKRFCGGPNDRSEDA